MATNFAERRKAEDNWFFWLTMFIFMWLVFIGCFIWGSYDEGKDFVHKEVAHYETFRNGTR